MNLDELLNDPIHYYIFDMIQYEIDHNILFLFHKLPGDIIKQVFEYINLGSEKNDYINSNILNRGFRTMSIDISNTLSIKDTIGFLNYIGKATNPIVLTSEDIQKIESLQYLKILNLVDVEFQNLPFCGRLKELSITNNFQLTAFNLSDLNQLTKLQLVDCHGLNSLKIDNCKNLKHLIISQCENLPQISNNLPSSLEYLSVFGSVRISQIPNCLINLKQLNISNSQVPTIPPELIKLTHIWAANNLSFNLIPNTLVNLKELHCKNTNLENIPKEFDKLKELNISATPILSLPSELTELYILELEDSNMIQVPSSFTNLYELNVNNSNVESIPKTFTKLRFLDCQHSHVTELSKDLVNLKGNTKAINLPRV